MNSGFALESYFKIIQHPVNKRGGDKIRPWSGESTWGALLIFKGLEDLDVFIDTALSLEYVLRVSDTSSCFSTGNILIEA